MFFTPSIRSSHGDSSHHDGSRATNSHQHPNNTKYLQDIDDVDDSNSSEDVEEEDEPANRGRRTNALNNAMIGKRTGIALPPRGQIPLELDGFESIDAFWNAARSPATFHSKRERSPSAVTKAEARRAEREREYHQVEGEKLLSRLELEEEARRNLSKKPEYLMDDHDSDENGICDNKRTSFVQTPQQPKWSNRLLHKAMGIPTQDSPTNTVLSRVSTAAPSSAKSDSTFSTISTASNKVKRAKEKSHATPSLDESSRDNDLLNDEEKRFDPPEEVEAADGSAYHAQGSSRRGFDPEEMLETNVMLDPEENFANDNDHFSTNLSSIVEEETEESQKSHQSGSQGHRSTPSKALDNSLEEVIETYDTEYNQEDQEAGGGIQLATQEDHSDEIQGQFENNDANIDDDTVSVQSPIHTQGSKYNSKKSKRAPVTPTSALRTKQSKKKHQNNRVNWSTPNGHSGYAVANREYTAVPVTDYKEHYLPGKEPRTPGGSELRRSRRAKFKPLQFWKNEKLIYQAQNEPGFLGEAMGDMPVVAGVQHALPTPHKEKSSVGKKNNGRKHRHTDEENHEGGTSAKVPFDSSKLTKKYKYSKGEQGSVWSEILEGTTETKVVSRLENRSFSKLPLSTMRKKNESKLVGFASQAFHVPADQDDLFPGYISGNVVLPPKGIKDAEGVGLCSQIFNVGDCQPNSVEFALADPSSQDGEFDPATAQRFLLSKGDMFQIPPGNVYRIENHSKTDKAYLYWTIIKCSSLAQQESDEE